MQMQMCPQGTQVRARHWDLRVLTFGNQSHDAQRSRCYADACAWCGSLASIQLEDYLRHCIAGAASSSDNNSRSDFMTPACMLELCWSALKHLRDWRIRTGGARRGAAAQQALAAHR